MKLTVNRKPNWLEVAGIIYTFSIVFSMSSGSNFVLFSRLLIVVIALLGALKNKKILKVDKVYYIWSLIFVAWCGLSYLWAVSKSLAVSGTLTVLYIVVVNWITFYAVSKRPEYIFTLMKTVIWAAIFRSAKVYLQNGIMVYLSSRGGAEVENATNVALMTSFGVIFAFIILSYKKTDNIFMYRFGLILNSVFSLFTASKKVFLYIGVFLIVYYILKSKNLLKLLRNIFLIILISFTTIYLALKMDFFYNLVGYRIQTMIVGFLGGETDSSTSFRLHLIQWGIEWFKEKPIVGYGISCYKYLLGTTYDTWVGTSGVYAHNNYIELLVDVGMIGTIIYYYIYVYTFVRGIKAIKRNKGLAVVSVALIVSMLVNEYGQISYSVPFLQQTLMIAWFLSNEDQTKFCIGRQSNLGGKDGRK